MIIDYSNAQFVQLREDGLQFDEMGISPVKKNTGILNAVEIFIAELKQKLQCDSFKDLDIAF